MTLIPASREISLSKVNSRAQWYFLCNYFVCSSIEELTIKVFFSFYPSLLSEFVVVSFTRGTLAEEPTLARYIDFYLWDFLFSNAYIHNALSLPPSFLKKVLERLWNLKETGNNTNAKFWRATKCTCTVGNWKIENVHKENEGTEASKSGLQPRANKVANRFFSSVCACSYAVKIPLD